jgi:hypothetical protein
VCSLLKQGVILAGEAWIQEEHRHLGERSLCLYIGWRLYYVDLRFLRLVIVAARRIIAGRKRVEEVVLA